MAEARGRDTWQHTSSLLALIANAHRDAKKQKAFSPTDFNPYENRDSEVIPTKDFSILKEVFVNPKGKERKKS